MRPGDRNPFAPDPDDPITEAVFRDKLRPFSERLEAAGFVLAEGEEHPTWMRTSPGTEDDLDKVVFWRHPRLNRTLQAHVATTRADFMVHMRFFDSAWMPATIHPGYIDKGWEFADAEELETVARGLSESLLAQTLSWFEEPVTAEVIMGSSGRVCSTVVPGPMLERHRSRADWLDARGRGEEAAWLRALIAQIESLYDRDPF